MIHLEKKELKIIGIITGILFLWFGFLLDKWYNIANGNVLLYYFLFLIAYSILVLKFIFEMKIEIRQIIAFSLVFLVGDLLLFPILISKENPPMLPIEAQYSSDLFIYNLIPDSIPHIFKYYLTYVLIPILLLGVAALLLKRNRFTSFVKGAF